jgi:hypothetical protein
MPYLTHIKFHYAQYCTHINRVKDEVNKLLGQIPKEEEFQLLQEIEKLENVRKSLKTNIEGVITEKIDELKPDLQSFRKDNEKYNTELTSTVKQTLKEPLMTLLMKDIIQDTQRLPSDVFEQICDNFLENLSQEFAKQLKQRSSQMETNLDSLPKKITVDTESDIFKKSFTKAVPMLIALLDRQGVPVRTIQPSHLLNAVMPYINHLFALPNNKKLDKVNLDKINSALEYGFKNLKAIESKVLNLKAKIPASQPLPVSMLKH